MTTDLLSALQQEEPTLEELLNPQYQSNMYLIESALRDTGADKSQVIYTRSPYDQELMRLIDSVPMR